MIEVHIKSSWYLYKVVVQNFLRTYKVIKVISENQILRLCRSNCLQQIDKPDLLHMCAPCSELPCNIMLIHRDREASLLK